MEVMGDYNSTKNDTAPDGWELKPFGSVVNKIVGGGTPSRSIPAYWGDEIPWVTVKDFATFDPYSAQEYITNIGLKNSASHLIPKETLITSTRMGLGKAVIFKVDVSINQDLKAIFPKTSIDLMFLYYWFQRNAELIVSMGSGSTVKGISLPELKRIDFLSPISKTEQTLISTALSDTDSYISSLEKLITKKRLIKQGTLQQLLTPKSHWVTKTLKEVATYRRGSFPQPYGLDKWYDDISGAPFVQVYDVADNFILKSETKWRISKEAQDMSVFVKKGSIILTIQGSIGRIAITQYDAYVDRTLLIFESFLMPFDRYFFMLSIFLLFEYEKQNAPGGIIKTITKEALSSFKIAFPKIEEQSYIASIISDINSEIESLEIKLSKALQIKQGMLQQLLTGKLRLV